MKVSARNRRNYAGRNRRWAYPNLNESLHPKVQNKRSSSHPNPSQQPILLEVPQAAGNSLFGFRGKCLGEASMKALPKRKGNSYPKIARNHAAETGASREPRGGYTQNYTLQPHLPPHNSLAREETMRATRHVPVTYQVLAHTKTPAGCFLSDPARVLTYERGWRGSGKPD